MKKLILIFICHLSINAYSQSGLYIVSEKFNYSPPPSTTPYYDSVFVTNPLGITTVSVIPNLNKNLKTHNSSLNLIFNAITVLGYKMVGNGPLQQGFEVYSYMNTWYFQQPWTTAGLKPAGVNSSEFRIEKVYPNPCDEVLNIKLSKKMSNAYIVILSLKGYIIHKTDINETDFISIDVRKFSSATYIVRLVDDKFYSEAVKIIVQ